MDRRQFLTTSASAALLGMTPKIAAAQQAQPDYYPADNGKVIEASRAEGEVLLYSIMDDARWAPFFEKFKAHYPWISIKNADLAPTEVLQRYMSESKAGSQTADVLAMNIMSSWKQLADAGELADYKSPEASHLPDWVPFANVYPTALDHHLIIWNKQIIPDASAPKSMQDLVDLVKEKPEIFQSQKLTTYAVHLEPVGYLLSHALTAHHGEKAWQWFEALGPATRPEASGGLMVEKVTVGEYAGAYLCPSGPVWKALLQPGRGDLLGWTYIGDGTPVLMRAAGIPKNAKHANSARLLLDFMLSREGQIALAENAPPVRSDIAQADVPPNAHTYSSLVEAVGEKNVIQADFVAGVVEDYEAFLKRWRAIYKV
jgi:iron(III) transport system substrate-binding protein